MQLCLLVGDPYAHAHDGVARLTKPGRDKAVADTSGENQAGFAYDTTVVTAFSHTHDSGTGGVWRSLFSLRPFSNSLDQSPSLEIFPYFLTQIALKTISTTANGSSRTGLWRVFWHRIAEWHQSRDDDNESFPIYRFTFNQTSAGPLGPVIPCRSHGSALVPIEWDC